MSLYDGLETFALPTTSEAKNEPKGNDSWSSSLKLLQSHIHLKKVTNAVNRDARKGVASTSALASDVGTTAKVVEKSRKVIVEDIPPLSFLPLQETDSFADEWHVEDEYNPLYPNVYEKLVEERDQERLRQVVQFQQGLALNYSSSSDEEEWTVSKKESNREMEKRSMGAAIAPPQQLVEEDSKVFDQPTTGPGSFQTDYKQPGGSRGMTFAAKIMQRYGYKQGSGLGKDEQGMSTALLVEKMGVGLGKIVHERDLVKDEVVPTVDTAEMLPGHVPEPPVQAVTEMLKNPTKVMLLRNMVGAGEVDVDLQPEVQEEMLKYGDVKHCLIHEVPNVADWEAVRIFVEFARVEQAIKAVVALNGRFFGGRTVHASFYDPDKFSKGELID